MTTISEERAIDELRVALEPQLNNYAFALRRWGKEVNHPRHVIEAENALLLSIVRRTADIPIVRGEMRPDLLPRHEHENGDGV